MSNWNMYQQNTGDYLADFAPDEHLEHIEDYVNDMLEHEDNPYATSMLDRLADFSDYCQAITS